MFVCHYMYTIHDVVVISGTETQCCCLQLKNYNMYTALCKCYIG